MIGWSLFLIITGTSENCKRILFTGSTFDKRHRRYERHNDVKRKKKLYRKKSENTIAPGGRFLYNERIPDLKEMEMAAEGECPPSSRLKDREEQP